MLSDPIAPALKSALPFVEGEICFSTLLSPDGEPLQLASFGKPEDEDRRVVQIADARAIRDQLAFDRQGFILIDSPTAIEEFTEDQSWMKAYEIETEQLMLRITGADKVLTGQTLARISHAAPADAIDGPVFHPPADQAHNDYGYTRSRNKTPTPRTLELMGKAGVDLTRKIRWQNYNVWRAVSPPPQDRPLVLCDSDTIFQEDLVPTEWPLKFQDGTEFIVNSDQIRYNPKQRWCYFSNMTRDEAIIFSGFDAWTEDFRIVPHSSFLDKSRADHAEPRKSVESRILAVFYDDENGVLAQA